MGSVPSKFAPLPTPFGASPAAATNVLQTAQAAPPAPLQNFLPLNPADPSLQQSPSSSTTTKKPTAGPLNPIFSRQGFSPFIDPNRQF